MPSLLRRRLPPGRASSRTAGEHQRRRVRVRRLVPTGRRRRRGTIRPMETTLDAAGRLTVPEEIREQAGLTPGMLLEVRFRDGRIEIEPATMEVDLVRKGRFLVAVPRGVVPVLTIDEVERTREGLRQERERQVLG